METERKKTGIIYCRVSSQEQIEGTSLLMQERNCFEYAVRENIEIITKPFIEQGESAKTTKRTEFQKALSFCANKKQKVDFFIVHKIDRFARNQNDHAMTQTFLKKFGTKLRSVTEQIDESPVGKAMEGMLSVFAEFDNNVRASRSKSGMEERIRQGVWVWQAPLGYKRNIKGGNLVPDEKIAPYIQLAFSEYSKGTYTYRSLANFLVQRGFQTKNGNKPTCSLMEKILRNQIYMAVMNVWGQEYKGSFEALVDAELFWKCQPGSKRKRKTQNRYTQNPAFPLKKLVICTACNKPLTGSSSRGGRGVHYPYYHHHSQECELAKSIPKHDLEEMFVSYLTKISPAQEYEDLFKSVVVDVWQSNYKKLDQNNESIRKEISKLESDRQKIFDLHRYGTYSDSEFIQQKLLINQQIYAKRQLLEDNHVEEFDMDEALGFCFNFIRNSAETWTSLEDSPMLRSRFQNQVFPEKLVFDGEKLGTTELSLVYRLNEENNAEKSNLVTLRRVELRFSP